MIVIALDLKREAHPTTRVKRVRSMRLLPLGLWPHAHIRAARHVSMGENLGICIRFSSTSVNWSHLLYCISFAAAGAKPSLLDDCDVAPANAVLLSLPIVLLTLPRVLLSLSVVLLPGVLVVDFGGRDSGGLVPLCIPLCIVSPWAPLPIEPLSLSGHHLLLLTQRFALPCAWGASS